MQSWEQVSCLYPSGPLLNVQCSYDHKCLEYIIKYKYFHPSDTTGPGYNLVLLGNLKGILKTLFLKM